MRLPPVAQMLAVLNSVVLSLMDLHQVATSLANVGVSLLILTRLLPGSSTFEKPCLPGQQTAFGLNSAADKLIKW